jgi:hypothetical protein
MTAIWKARAKERQALSEFRHRSAEMSKAVIANDAAIGRLLSINGSAVLRENREGLPRR